jgi:hypothetical protein
MRGACNFTWIISQKTQGILPANKRKKDEEHWNTEWSLRIEDDAREKNFSIRAIESTTFSITTDSCWFFLDPQIVVKCEKGLSIKKKETLITIRRKGIDYSE